jgi:deazaflavin-dependent oxidoreductase (nitroreductase family)
MGFLTALVNRLPAGLRRHAVVLKGSRAIAFDRFVLRWTGLSLVTLQYAVARGQPYCPTLLLTTTGRSSGQPRTVALPWVRDGDRLVVCGSAAGGPKDPAWVGNLRARPHCVIRRSGRVESAVAHIATGAERERLFARLAAVRPSVVAYEEQASRHGRRVPIVVLSPDWSRAPGGYLRHRGR